MWLLTASIILFFIVIGLIVYANWPASSSGRSCGGGCGGGCPDCPCKRCTMPRRQCGCHEKEKGCGFC